MSIRVKTGFWVRALLRRIASQGRSAMVIRRGDEDAGAVLIALIDRSGAVGMLREETTIDGEGSGWTRVPVADQAALDSYVERQRGYDPDLWVIELETSSVTDPVEEGLGSRRGPDNTL